MTYDAIIVLGNLMDSDGILNEESRFRMDTCIKAYLENEAPKIITCGWNYRDDSNIKIADAMKAYAIEKGIPGTSIITETNSRDTVGDAIFTKVKIVERNNMKNLLVVTSNYHLSRTLEIFRFIYGESFHVDGKGAPSAESDLLNESEKRSIEAFRKTFFGIKAGSNDMIINRLVAKHPFYNGEIYPEYVFQEFKESADMKKENVLFLGDENSPVVTYLRQIGENVFCTNEKITSEFINRRDFTFLISYGYRYILRNDVLDLFKNKAINLHISLLPWNRGADPNIWSFLEFTPKGVTIHHIDEGLDTGDIILQKEVFFDSSIETLSTSYSKLQQEIQDLFCSNWNNIKLGKCERVKQTLLPRNSTHKVKDKAPYEHLLVNGWNTKVSILEEYAAELELSVQYWEDYRNEVLSMKNNKENA